MHRNFGLSPYKPINYSDDNTKYIYQFGDYLDDTTWLDDETRWFTVFINEYTYETGNTTTHWKNYVNKDERKAWFIADKHQNDDQTSVHFKAKYGLSQQSIQTYYNSDPTSPTEKAIGVEHFNETIGARLRWDGPTNFTQVNGKTNLINYCSGQNWENYITTEAYNTPEITNQGKEPSHPTYLPKLKTLKEAPDNQKTGFYDPEFNNPDKKFGEYYVGVVNACMNRNRDLDGNGVISTNEIRWYVPTARQYQRIILGRNSLASPIMQNFNNIKLYDSSGSISDVNNKNTRYHLASSDCQMIWAEEGLSRSGFHDGGSWQFGAWQVRCIRNLGTDDETADNIVIPQAYHKVDGKNVFEMDRYDSRSVRNNKILGAMPPHNIYNQTYNRVYKAFQYTDASKEIGNNYDGLGITLNSPYFSDWYNILSTSNPCDYLNTNIPEGESRWRVPNQKEITMMIYNEILFESWGTYTHLSATFEFFDYNGLGYNQYISSDVDRIGGRRFLGHNFSDGNYYAATLNTPLSTPKIRCVRDVDPDEY